MNEQIFQDILAELRAIRTALDTQNAPVRAEYYRQLAKGPLTPETIKQHNDTILERHKRHHHA